MGWDVQLVMDLYTKSDEPRERERERKKKKSEKEGKGGEGKGGGKGKREGSKVREGEAEGGGARWQGGAAKAIRHRMHRTCSYRWRHKDTYIYPLHRTTPLRSSPLTLSDRSSMDGNDSAASDSSSCHSITPAP